MKYSFLGLLCMISTSASAVCYQARGSVQGSNLPAKVCFHDIYFQEDSGGKNLEIIGGDLAGIYPTAEERVGGDQRIQFDARKIYLDLPGANCGKSKKAELIIMAEFDSEVPMEALYVEVSGQYSYNLNSCHSTANVTNIEYDLVK